MKLNKEEMKNVMGGDIDYEVSSFSETCYLTFSNGQVISQHVTNYGERVFWEQTCSEDPTCLNPFCF